MNKSKIVSPMVLGSGAHVVHQLLEKNIPQYSLVAYHPWWTLFPFLLPVVAPVRNADLIHTTPDYAIYFKRKNIPLVLTIHNYVLDPATKSFSSWLQKVHYAIDLRLATKKAVQRADVLVSVSKFTARLIQKDLNINLPIEIIYNGVDQNSFIPAPRNGKRKEIRAFFAGNLTRRKGAQWLPEISKLLSHDIKIYYTQGLRTRKILPDLPNLIPLGPVPFQNMPQRYCQMDILLMPTVREGLSLAVLEAMACGLPVVASNCSSLPEQIDEGKGGFLCPVGDVKAFAEKINLLTDSPKLRKEMGSYNRSKVEKLFTLDKMINAYNNLFDSMLR